MAFRLLPALIFFSLSVSGLSAQYRSDSGLEDKESSFKPGEWLKFRVHYGIFNASYATLHLTSDTLEDTQVYHVVGTGKTTGLANIFFKVDDRYESFFGKSDGRPYRFIRKINEGGYTRDVEINFDYALGKALYHDKKNDKKLQFEIGYSIQDLISAFYYLRNAYEVSDLVVGESLKLKMLFDDDGILDFRLKFLGIETVKTKFGKVECLKFRPIVQAGRVFKEEESLSLWVSNDKNKIPIRIQADLLVGSIKADLEAYNSLKNQFKIIID